MLLDGAGVPLLAGGKCPPLEGPPVPLLPPYCPMATLLSFHSMQAGRLTLEGLWPECKEVADQRMSVGFPHLLSLQKIFQWD